MMCGFREDLWRCISMKIGLEEMSEFHDLQTHLSFMSDLTSRKESTSGMSSSGRIGDDIGVSCCWKKAQAEIAYRHL